MRDFDLIVLGAGNSADVHRAADAAGLRTAVVEKGALGGTCPNRGCIPSKLPLAHADRADAIRSSDRFHIDSRIDAIDGDAILRASAPGVHALGDVAGKHFFTHTASLEAKYLGRLLTGATEEPLDYGQVPHAVFTDPELAGVGRTERELQDGGVDYVKATLPFANVTKGRAIKEEHGLAKLLVARDGSILGAHLVGAHASILLHEIVAVMKWRNDVRSLTEMIHVHPSLPEVIGGVASRAVATLREAGWNGDGR